MYMLAVRVCDEFFRPGLFVLFMVSIALVSLQCHEVVAQSDDDASVATETSDRDVASMRKRFLDTAAVFAFVGGANQSETFQLIPEPVLNWSNPERRTSAGGMFLWTLHGRPMVAMCGYPTAELGFDGNVVYDCEFQSLATGTFIANENGVRVWEPNQAGVNFQSFGSELAPAASIAARMLQMRRLSREFSGKLVPPERTEIPLRMLSSPIYRYPEPTTASDYVDGAIFALVQGTDPEVLLKIEAVTIGDDQVKWRYALSRMSMVPTEVRHREALVWETQWAIKNRSTPYFVIKR